MCHIVVVGSFDTKSEPIVQLIEELSAAGERPTTIDTSVFAGKHICDYSAVAVAGAAGKRSQDLPALGRAAAVNVMADGAARILEELCDRREVSALVCMGGSNAATIFSRLTGTIPIGLPKILMATVVAGETRPLVNASDAILLYPIVDIEGDNGILRQMIRRLAAIAVAAANSAFSSSSIEADKSIALTMFGVTTACVAQCRALLTNAGLQSLVFHANGSGGKSVERFIAQSLVSSLIDVTTTELADELFGGLLPAGPDRLRTAARMGVPQVLAPGAMDMINFGPMATVPETFRKRKLLAHNDLVTLVRTTAEENRRLGAELGTRLAEAVAPTSVLIPLRGVSALDKVGAPFFDPGAILAFAEGLRSSTGPSVEIVDLDLHINDPEFAAALVETALRGRRGLVGRK